MQEKMKPSDVGCHVIDHPVLAHYLTLLRDRRTSPPEFRSALGQMSRLIAYEATRSLRTAPVTIDTPLESGFASPTIGEGIIVVAIMRAGNGMLSGVMDTLPFAKVGHIGIYRDKFIQNTVEYFFRIPKDAQGKRVLLLDPLLATGDTAVSAIQRLKEYGVGPIQFGCILASPEGLAKIREHHPETEVLCVSVERGLDKNGYILPGLGDAGDRLYGTV